MFIKLVNWNEAQNLTNKCVNVMYSKIDKQKIRDTNLAAITCTVYVEHLIIVPTVKL